MKLLLGAKKWYKMVIFAFQKAKFASARRYTRRVDTSEAWLGQAMGSQFCTVSPFCPSTLKFSLGVGRSLEN